LLGPLDKLGRVADAGIGTFVGLLAFTLPISASWKIGVIVRSTDHFAIFGDLSQVIYAATVITLLALVIALIYVGTLYEPEVR